MFAGQQLYTIWLQKVALHDIMAGRGPYVTVLATQHQERAIGQSQPKLLIGPCSRTEWDRKSRAASRE